MNFQTIALLLSLAVTLAVSAAVAQNVADSTKQASQISEVVLSQQHRAMVLVDVGEEFPEMALPTSTQGGDPTPLANRLATNATVIALFDNDGVMAKTLIRDLQADINEQYNPPVADAKAQSVATVAIASNIETETATELTEQLGYKGLLLLDHDAKATELLGTGRMPRVFVLDGEGEIVWFDIEYSLSTRRELKQAVASLVHKSKAE